MSATKGEITVDNQKITIENENNLLEILRKAKVDIPTFCYHSELSLYGACRLCLVDVQGRGLLASCSTKPTDGMVIKTNTQELREMRKVTLELLLANHDNSCTTCAKSSSCKLKELAARFGVNEIRFKRKTNYAKIDRSSDSLIRDPNKCILCGDCVRYCKEIQGIGAIDFAFRGKETVVIPAFGGNLGQVECVNCGQCASVCPTGAIIPKPEIQNVWNLLNDKTKTVVVQLAPAVRVAIGEEFGIDAKIDVTGKVVAALKRMGFNKVFDTTYAADLTVIEETNEFIARKTSNSNLPLFTSCCPGWVKFAEQYYPNMLSNLSTCKSPQQMFGSLLKEKLAIDLKMDKKNIIVVSIMPCTAKKYEAKRPEFSKNGIREVDAVITTQELAKMINEAGIVFSEIRPESMDLPFGLGTGAGVIFGNSGGVSEAVLRYASEKLTNDKNYQPIVEIIPKPAEGLVEQVVTIGNLTLRLAVVSGLKNARRLVDNVVGKKVNYDLIEVMACPGGCIGGAGQPLPNTKETRKQRTQSLSDVDRSFQIHKAQDNPYIQQLYTDFLHEPNSHIAHELLHTAYQPKKRIESEGIELQAAKDPQIKVSVCVGTNCYLHGSQKLISDIMDHTKNAELTDKVAITATFCMEKCRTGPNAKVNDQEIEYANLEKIKKAIDTELKRTN